MIELEDISMSLCPVMLQALRKEARTIEYFPVDCSFAICLIGGSFQTIEYCPWCGKKLPKV